MEDHTLHGNLMLRIFRQYYPIRNLFFVFGEFAVIFLSTIFANWVFYGFDHVVGNWALYFRILIITSVTQTCLYYNDLYDLQVTDSFGELSVRLLQSLGAGAIILAGIYLLFPWVSMGMDVFTVSIIFDILFIVFWRFGYTALLNQRWLDQRILILGFNPLTAKVLQEINERKDCGYMVAGVILEPGVSLVQTSEGMPAAEGRFLPFPETGLCQYAEKENIQKIVVGLDEKNDHFPVQELLRCRINGIEVLEGSSFFEMLTGKLLVDHIKPEWLIFSDGFRQSWGKRFVKRTIDLTISIAMLVLLLPLILVIAVLVKLDHKEPEVSPKDVWCYFPKFCDAERIALSEQIRFLLRDYIQFEGQNSFSLLWKRFKEKCAQEDIPPSGKLLGLIRSRIDAVRPEDQQGKRPVFFSQERVGQNGRIYRVHKFRSMVVNAERYSGPVWAGEDDKRITRIGNFIRKWRIDEIPQLWNVLKGEMSFVGPRPERDHFVEQLEKTIPYYRERLTVKPGLTGWAQVSYGYGASEDDAKEKLNYDLFYIKNMSIPMDLMIVLRTIKIVIFGMGR